MSVREYKWSNKAFVDIPSPMPTAMAVAMWLITIAVISANVQVLRVLDTNINSSRPSDAYMRQ